MLCCGCNNSRFEESGIRLSTENFSREEQEIHNVIHAKAIANLNEYERQGYKCLLYREEPFMYARDSITYKEHVLVYINGIISRKAKIVSFE